MRATALLICASLIGCGAAPAPTRSLDPNADVVVPYPVSGGGEVRFTVHPRYAVGGSVALQVDIRSGTQEIRGPLAGQVLASELGSGEQLVRNMTPSELQRTDVRPGQKDRIEVTWDGRNDKGEFVPPQTYSLSLYFVVGETAQRIGTVIEIRAP